MTAPTENLATKRLLLALGVGFVALALLAAKLGEPRVQGAPRLPSSAPTPHLPPHLGLRFLALGDQGMGNTAQRDVGRAMAQKARADGADFVLLLGDNFYPGGVETPFDEAWRTAFLEPYALPELQIPFYAALGNHDHHGNPDAQVEASDESGVWHMPARHYTFESDVPGSSAAAQFFVLDTTPIHRREAGSEAQVAWFERELLRSTAEWKVVVGHHPIVSGGKHGGSEAVGEALRETIRRHGVDLYLSGHDHDMQLHPLGESALQLVCGAGSKLRSVRWIDSTRFAAVELGFLWIRIDADGVAIEFVDREARVLHSHRVPAKASIG